MIEIEDVHKSYGQLEVLKGVTLSVSKGEVLSIIGGSGSGKSTLLTCINGLEDIQRGRILVDGVEVHARGTDLNQLRQKIGIVFQQWNAFPHLTVLENVMLAPRKVLGKTRADAEALAVEQLKRVGLSDKMNVFPSRLSGGQQQRMAIARALAMQPRILLMDEPFAALDALTRRRMQEELQQLWEASPFTLLFVTHSIEEALVLGSRILLLSPHPGRVRAELNAHQFGLHSPGSPAFQGAARRIHDMLFATQQAASVVDQAAVA